MSTAIGRWLRELARNEDGPPAVAYLMLGLLIMGYVTALSTLKLNADNTFNKVSAGTYAKKPF